MPAKKTMTPFEPGNHEEIGIRIVRRIEDRATSNGKKLSYRERWQYEVFFYCCRETGRLTHKSISKRFEKREDGKKEFGCTSCIGRKTPYVPREHRQLPQPRTRGPDWAVPPSVLASLGR